MGKLTACPACVPGDDSSVGKLAVCPPCVPGDDSSVGSSLSDLPVTRVIIAQWDSSLSVLPVSRVMIAQWESSLSDLPVTQVIIAQWDSSLSVLPVARVQFPTVVEYFKGFSQADHKCCLVHSSGRTKEWSGVPLEKSLQSHEDHEMPTEKPKTCQTLAFEKAGQI